MRPVSLARLALVAVLVLAAGCSSNSGKIESTTWASVAVTTNGEDHPDGAQRLQFAKDGHFFYTILGKPYRGNYTLGMGPAVTVTLEQDLEGRKIHPYKVVIDGEQLTLTRADGSEQMFHRIN